LSRPGCGDGKYNPSTGFEQCDDGNDNNTDGCSNLCTFTDPTQWDCTNTPGKKTVCVEKVCGDGRNDTSPFYEECDDGNTVSGDGCESNCSITYDYKF
jgi:cysteine-rich repeat protein